MHKVKQMERNVLNKSFQGAHKSNRKYNFFCLVFQPTVVVRVHIYIHCIHLFIRQQQKVASRGQGINGNFIKPTPKKKPPSSTAPSRGKTFAYLFSLTPPFHRPTALRTTVNDEAVVVKKILLCKLTPAVARRSQCSRFVLVFHLLIFCIRNAEQTPR